MIQTRTKFKSWIQSQFNEKNMDRDDSPVWIPEHDLNGAECQWFVTVRCVRKAAGVTKPEYWAWCADNLTGSVCCFMSNKEDDHEVWGFTELDDVDWWMLKWSR
jgi:hypothetical protein